MNMPWKSIVLTLVIGWCLGAACGVLFLRHARPRLSMAHTHRARFYKELGLSADQRAQVDAILAAKHERMSQIFAQTNIQIENVRISTHDEIRKLLTPAQQEKFDRMAAAFARRFKQRYELNHSRP